MASARHLAARISALANLVLSELLSPRELQGGAIMLIGISVPIIGWARLRAVRAALGGVEAEWSGGS
jgi:hypothetical protein